jgi:hypothetical protein
MDDKVILYKVALGILCALGCVLCVRSRIIEALTERRFEALILLIWAVTRLGLYCAAFIVLGMSVTSDVAGFYFPEGKHALAGEIVYRDFTSNYSPAFSYLIALILNAWNSPKAIVLATTLIDGVSLAIWMRVRRAMWPGEEGRTLIIFYVFGSFAILDAAIAGQNQVWVALLLGLAVLLFERGQIALSAAVAGLPVLLVKFLALLYVPLFFRARSKPLQMVSAALVLPAVAFGSMWLMGIDVLQPVRLQGALVTTGNIPYLLSFIRFSAWESALMQAFALLALAALCLYWFVRPAVLEANQIVIGLVVFTLTCALLNQKFFTNYLMMVFAPICAVATLSELPLTAAVRFGVFNLLVSLEPSLWFRLLHAEERHSRLWEVVPRLEQSGELWRLWIFLAVEVTLLVFYADYLLKAWNLLRRMGFKSRNLRRFDNLTHH